MRVCIIQNDINNPPKYIETHDVRTNQYGLVSIMIGQGLPTTGSFDVIAWNQETYARMDIDHQGGTNFRHIGTSEITPVPTALYAKTAESVKNSFGLNVQCFGAFGNGVDDDFLAFQEAVDSASIKGHKLFVPAGTYKLTQTVEVPAGVQIIGETMGSDPLQTPNNGSLIAFEGMDFAFRFSGNNSGMQDIVIKDFNVGSAAGGIHIQSNGTAVESCNFHNVLITNFTQGIGVKMEATNTSGIAYTTFYNLRVRNAKTGIHIEEQSGSFVNSNSFFHGVISGGAYDYGVRILGGNNNVFHGTVIEPPQTQIGHFVVEGGEVRAHDIRVEGMTQDPSTPLVEFKPGTLNSELSATFGGGGVVDNGNNTVEIKNCKGGYFSNPKGNVFQNSVFNGWDGSDLPHWDISGSGVVATVLAPDQVKGHNVLQIDVPAGVIAEIKPSGDVMPSPEALGIYDQANFGMLIKTTTADIAQMAMDAPAGVKVSAKHPGNGEWRFIGSNGLVDRQKSVNARLYIHNTSGSTATVYVCAPTFSFGNQVPDMAPKDLSTAGGIMNGAITHSMETISTIPGNTFLTISKSANIYDIAASSGTITRINHGGPDRLPKGTVIQLLFANAGINVSNNPYISLKGGFTSIANSSISLVSMGNGTWREVDRNN
ncbi:MAG: glycosyl hydrolase family 28-related protein [Bacteroidota bacterium]